MDNSFFLSGVALSQPVEPADCLPDFDFFSLAGAVETRAARDGGSPEATLNIAAAVATLSEFAIPSMGITTAASAASTTSARRHRAPRPSLESPERPARAVVCSATTTQAPSAFVSVTASAAFWRSLHVPSFESLVPLVRACVCVTPPSCRKPPIFARETHRRAGKCRRCCKSGSRRPARSVIGLRGRKRNWSRVALVRRNSGHRQCPAHVRATRQPAAPDCQYSSASMMVITRSVTEGSDGSGE